MVRGPRGSRESSGIPGNVHGGTAAGWWADSVLGCAAAELRAGSSRAGVRRAKTGMLVNRVDTCGDWDQGNARDWGNKVRRKCVDEMSQATGEHADYIYGWCARQDPGTHKHDFCPGLTLRARTQPPSVRPSTIVPCNTRHHSGIGSQGVTRPRDPV